MKRFAYVSALLVATSLAAACSIDVRGNGGGVGTSIREEKRFTLSDTDPAELTLRTFDGAIQLRSWDRNEVLVEIERRGPDQASAEALTVNTSQDGNRITVEAESERDGVSFGNWTSRSVSLTVTAPKRVKLEARTGDGSIAAADFAGDVDVSSGDGRIQVSRIDGRLKAHSGDGAIRADDIAGEVDADSGDGSIEIAGRLSVLTVRTGDGGVRVEASDGSAMKSDWRITTGDGSITLRVPDGFGAEVDATTGDGSIRIDGVSSSSSDDRDRRAVKGQLGSGGRTLQLRSGDGSITVSR